MPSPATPSPAAPTRTTTRSSPAPAPLHLPPYQPRRASSSRMLRLRGVDHHVRLWGSADTVTDETPPLVLLHGWMDVGASFQFMVDALARERWVIAPDWRGFGLTRGPEVDSYWFADYLGDLDALLDALLPPTQAIDLLGHSMGGNVAMSYAGVRPARVRRLVNLEGFGLPATTPAQAPARLAKWLDELKTPQTIRSYASLDGVVERLMKNNPRLAPQRAAWLAGHWSEQRADGRWHILGDAAHKRSNPVLYRVDEILAGWQAIRAPLLWIEGDATELATWWGTRYSKEEFHQRLALVPQVERQRLADCGHMLHHDQPQALAERIEAFLG